MSKKTNRAANAAIANNVTAEADEWKRINEFFPDAVTALSEYAFMYGLCVPVMFKKTDRAEPKSLARILDRATLRADGGKPLTLTYCWKEEPEYFETGFFSEALWEGINELYHYAPASFAVLERMDALLPDVLSFPDCPRMFSPAALIRCVISSVRETAERAQASA